MFNLHNVLQPRSGDPRLHVVLGAPIDAEPQEGEEVIFFAAGCFWGVEKIFWSTPGVVTTATGYMGGHTPTPSYREVCTKTTGHAETVRVVFDTSRTSAAELIALFFEIHDPTQGDRQGNDIGPQYRSAIWTTTPEQYEVAAATLTAYQERLAQEGFPPITTGLADAEGVTFWEAEDYHQGYLFKNPDGYQCHSRTGVACPVVKGA
ncbi:peptide-methionine (S)-S-oxide reductase MsrA [Schaalia canis]|uniref:Peptide methionine sulfoxide reductase MsrA n=1 Tax=Schaalia canis TaxID=100469 RepID=A0A3P1SEE3_9ACTO|nr:peptide-methionine (S)-S-oxide reductase MsrA [Schaalia canis]RRC95518.1 peptide-methionine (S)-S-oxide reductase MsrA [Schaalia canis]